MSLATISTEVEWEAPDRLPVLVGAWLASHRSANTRTAYRRDLRAFLDFCDEQRVAPISASRPVVDAFARHQEHLGLAPSTVARRLSALGSFYGRFGFHGVVGVMVGSRSQLGLPA